MTKKLKTCRHTLQHICKPHKSTHKIWLAKELQTQRTTQRQILGQLQSVFQQQNLINNTHLLVYSDGTSEIRTERLFFNRYLFIVILLGLTLCISVNMLAQNISGVVTETLNKPLEFVTITLKSEDGKIKSNITNQNGDFQFQNILQGQKYYLHFSAIGYLIVDTTVFVNNTENINLTIILKAQIKNLAVVTVTSSKSLITRKADRFIVNVENSFLSTGYNALDILQRSPGIWIDNTGVIKLRGKTNITVMVNNVLQRMSYDELSDFLKTLKSETIAKIEVVTNPGAEFDAESSGGFVNIILKKARKEGLLGNIGTTYKQQEKWSYLSPSVSLNLKTKKLGTYASYSTVFDNNEHFAITKISYPNQQYNNTNTTISEKKHRQQFIVGLIYEPSKNETFGVQNIYTVNDLNHNFNTSIESNINGGNFTGHAFTISHKSNWRNSTTINYNRIIDTLGSSLSIIADYTYNKNKGNTNFNSRYSNATQDSIYRNNAPFSTHISAIQLDYKKVLPKSIELKIGGKASFIVRNNDLVTENFYPPSWKIDSSASNIYSYNEKIFATYSTLNKSFGKSDVSAGLRCEYTFSEGHSITDNKTITSNYINLFPSFSIQNTFNEKNQHSIYFSFNMPFTRPDFNTLNPYRLKIDNFSYQIGNPNLKPQTGYSLDAGINLFNKYNIGIYYTLTKKVFANINTPVANNIILYQTINFTNSNEIGLYTTIPLKISKHWATTTDAQIYYSKYSLQSYNNSQLSYSAQLVQVIALPKLFDIDIISKFQSPYVYSNARAAYQFYTDIGFTRKIFKGKGKLRFVASDVTNSLRDKNITSYNNTIIDFYQKKPTRIFALSIFYNFSKGVNFKAKGVNQLSNEEKSRLDK